MAAHGSATSTPSRVVRELETDRVMREFKTEAAAMSRRSRGGYNEGRQIDLDRISGARMRWSRSGLSAVTLTLGLAANSWAGAPTDQLRAYTDQILKVLENPSLSLPEKRAQVRKVASEAFDTTETAQRVLGLHWRERTPAEQEEFTKLF